MNANTQNPRDTSLTSRIKPFESSEERPPDRELRRLHGLSADVGAACNAWLNNRGIKTRAWGEFNLSRAPRKPPQVEFSMDSDS